MVSMNSADLILQLSSFSTVTVLILNEPHVKKWKKNEILLIIMYDPSATQKKLCVAGYEARCDIPFLSIYSATVAKRGKCGSKWDMLRELISGRNIINLNY